jgi:hypothetical protein
MRPRGRFALTLTLPLLALGLCGPLLGADQVAKLQARHAAGQTFLTWQEAAPPPVAESATAVEVRKLQQELARDRKTRYRIYRSAKPITSLEGLTPIAEVPPMTGWNSDYYGDPKPKDPALRYVAEEGKPPVAPGTGLYVHNPKAAGEACYAVTACIDGKEWSDVGGTVTWKPHAGRNTLEARSLNKWDIDGPVGTVELDVK